MCTRSVCLNHLWHKRCASKFSWVITRSPLNRFKPAIPGLRSAMLSVHHSSFDLMMKSVCAWVSFLQKILQT